MKPLDRLLQRWRIAKARRWVASGARVLDIGCHDGELFHRLADRISGGVGVDPTLEAPVEEETFRLLPGLFPAALGKDAGEPFEAITLLAVLEHIPPAEQGELARECARRLAPGGHLIVTVPSPLVDRILDLLSALRLIDGMSLEEHYGFKPRDTPRIFTGYGLRLIADRSFQLGLNHLYVFRKEGDAV